MKLLLLLLLLAACEMPTDPTTPPDVRSFCWTPADILAPERDAPTYWTGEELFICAGDRRNLHCRFDAFGKLACRLSGGRP